MKSPGATLDYAIERNRDIERAYREQIAAAEHINILEIFRKIAKSPSARFWVSPERAHTVISMMARGVQLPKMRDTKRRMFNEIYRRVRAMLRKDPGMSMREATFAVVYQPAPEFYLQPRSIGLFLYKYKKTQDYADRRIAFRK